MRRLLTSVLAVILSVSGVVFPAWCSASVMTAYAFDQATADAAFLGAYVPSDYPDGETTGMFFTPLQDIRVTALGYFDFVSTFFSFDTNGLVQSHLVTLYDASTRALLASVTIGPGLPPLDNNYRYLDLPIPVNLEANHTYVVAGYTAHFTPVTMFPLREVDAVYFAVTNLIAMDPNWDYVSDPELLSVNSLLQYEGANWVFAQAFPDYYTNLREYLYVPSANFQFELLDAVAVPEPSTLALTSMAAIGMAFAAARRRFYQPRTAPACGRVFVGTK